jgi:hypothetical protein
MFLYLTLLTDVQWGKLKINFWSENYELVVSNSAESKREMHP